MSKSTLIPNQDPAPITAVEILFLLELELELKKDKNTLIPNPDSDPAQEL